jgi:hypothetical protein
MPCSDAHFLLPQRTHPPSLRESQYLLPTRAVTRKARHLSMVPSEWLKAITPSWSSTRRCLAWRGLPLIRTDSPPLTQGLPPRDLSTAACIGGQRGRIRSGGQPLVIIMYTRRVIRKRIGRRVARPWTGNGGYARIARFASYKRDAARVRSAIRQARLKTVRQRKGEQRIDSDDNHG